MTDAKCPKCGSTAGYVEKWQCTHAQYYDFEGSAWDCEVTRDRGGKRKQCADCKKDITAFVLELQSQDA